MGPTIFFTTFLAGFYSFGAIYLSILWARARRDGVLFALAAICLGSSVDSVALLMMLLSETVAEGQRGSDIRSVVVRLQLIALVWLLSLIGGLRPRWYLWPVTGALAAGLLAALLGAPSLPVVGVERLTTPWGETISVLTRVPPGPWSILVYGVAASIAVFGLVCAARLWSRDRLGGALMTVASLGYAAGLAIAASIDLLGARLPYVGPALAVLCILPISWYVSRENQQRDAQSLSTHRRFRAIFDHTFQFTGLMDVDGTLLEVNRTALEYSGLGREDIVGKPFWDNPLWPDEVRAQMKEAVRTAGLGQVVRFKSVFPGADGRLRHIDFSLRPVRDESGTVMMLIPEGRDVTRRAEADAALRRSEERYRFLVQNQTEFIVSCLPDATITFVNASFCRYLGERADALAGTNVLDRFAADRRKRIETQLVDLTAETPVLTGDHVMTTKNGEQRWTQWTTSGVFDADGQMISLQLTGHDIHDRVMAEEARRKLEQQLLQSQKMEALGQLAGGVAHDFNNLLTVIGGHAEMVLLREESPNVRHDLDQIRLASDRAASMTRQLLAFSRQSILEPTVVNVNTVLAKTVTLLRRTIGDDIERTVRPAPDARHVKADPDQLGRVLLNMAINAHDAMPLGGRLVIETRNVTLDEGLAGARPHATPGEYVMLEMSDTGCGMSQETRARLFEPFYTTKAQGKGTGLGLAVVDGVVRQSGGFIDVTSEVGHGTTFRIYLPALDADPIIESESPKGPSTKRGNETVLLVEDEDAVRDMTRAALEHHGYTVLSAAGGAEALGILYANRERIGLVLSDVVMPGMSGQQLAARLHEEQPGLPVLFMSGYTSDTAFLEGVEAGEAHFLQKPFSVTALAAKVRQVLDEA